MSIGNKVAQNAIQRAAEEAVARLHDEVERKVINSLILGEFGILVEDQEVTNLNTGNDVILSSITLTDEVPYGQIHWLRDGRLTHITYYQPPKGKP